MEQIKILQETSVFVRVDDVGKDDLPHVSGIVDVCRQTNIPVILGVIPNLLSDETAGYLKCELEHHWPGLIIAQHGVSHNRCPGVVRKMEFSIWEPVCDVANKLLAGRENLQTRLGMNINWYVPPWNKYGHNLILALEEAGYQAFSAAKGMPFRSNYLANFPINQDVVIDYKIGKIEADPQCWWEATKRNLSEDGWCGLMLHHHLMNARHMRAFQEWAKTASTQITKGSINN